LAQLVEIRETVRRSSSRFMAHLARTHPDARVLLTTFSDTLASALHTKLKRLLGSEPRLAERIDVHSLNAIGLRLYKAHIGPATIASRTCASCWRKRQCRGRPQVWPAFLLTEWEQVVDAWQLDTGRRIAMWRASAGRPGCRRRSGRCCGPSSSAFAPGCAIGS
jgi:hypothetical protein